jgi:type IV fimbrial biogenesis protein FimT
MRSGILSAAGGGGRAGTQGRRGGSRGRGCGGGEGRGGKALGGGLREGALRAGARASSRRWHRGLTAFELIVALGIAALLATVAVPGFAGLRRSAGLGAAANELVSALHLARSAAGLRGLPVTVCLSVDERTCVTKPDVAALGWLVFHPESQAVTAQPTPAKLIHQFQLPADVTVSGTRPAVTFWPAARAGSTGTFELCDVHQRAPGRSIVLSQTGRPRVAMEQATCGR